jgi:uncharacterized protein YkwD
LNRGVRQVRRSIRPFVCACALVVTACNSPTSPTEVGGVAGTGSPALSATLTSIVELTNQERTRHGLSAVRLEGRLTQAAQIQADQMVRHNRMDHVMTDAQYPRPEDRLAAAGYAWQSYGENLAFGYADARSVVEGWMNSTGHRANILGTSFTEIGVGMARDAYGRPFYTQVFGRPR